MSQSIVSRAPFHMKYSRKSDFEPEFVSIGPYHNCNNVDGYKHMEDIKDRCTSYFYNQLKSTTNTTTSIDDLLSRINPDDEMETRIRAWYGGSINDDKAALFNMLLRDSCFIIGIVLSVAEEGHEISTFFQHGRDIKKIRFDLLLLENQIPFFFVMKVYDYFFKNEMLRPKSKPESENNSPSNSQHGNPNHSNAQGLQGSGFTACLPSLCSSAPHTVQSPELHTTQQSSTSSHFTSLQTSSERTSGTSIQLSLQNQQDTPQIDTLKLFLKELESFICLDMPWKFNKNEIDEAPYHLLDLYWRRCLPLNDDVSRTNIRLGGKGADPQNTGESLPNEDLNRQNKGEDEMPRSWVTIEVRTNAPKRIKNAYELYKKAGIKFEKTEHSKGFGLTFHKKGILELPHLQLDPSQAKLLVNLIAFEEFKDSSEKILTSYVLLFDGLINTEKDVELLQRYGVLTNKLGSSQMASTYFNDIGNICSVDYNKHYCQEQFLGLNSYYDSYWRCKFAILKNKYFNSPWSVISFLAGLTLLAITIVQLALASTQTHLNLKHHKHCP